MDIPNVNAAAVPRSMVSGTEGRRGAENSGSSFAKKAYNLAKSLTLHVGVPAGVAYVAANFETTRSALSPVFSKVADAVKEGGAFVGENLALFAVGSIAAGALNVLDGVCTVAVNARKSSELSKTYEDQHAAQPNQNRTDSFNKLKQLYASAQKRGAVQTAIGLTAGALGALTLVGVISNPIGLAVVGGGATLALAGVQIHKFIQNRKIKAETANFLATLPQQPNASEGSNVRGNNRQTSIQGSRHAAPPTPSTQGHNATASRLPANNGSVRRGQWQPELPGATPSASTHVVRNNTHFGLHDPSHQLIYVGAPLPRASSGQQASRTTSVGGPAGGASHGATGSASTHAAGNHGRRLAADTSATRFTPAMLKTMRAQESIIMEQTLRTASVADPSGVASRGAPPLATWGPSSQRTIDWVPKDDATFDLLPPDLEQQALRTTSVAAPSDGASRAAPPSSPTNAAYVNGRPSTQHTADRTHTAAGPRASTPSTLEQATAANRKQGGLGAGPSDGASRAAPPPAAGSNRGPRADASGWALRSAARTTSSNSNGGNGMTNPVPHSVSSHGSSGGRAGPLPPKSMWGSDMTITPQNRRPATIGAVDTRDQSAQRSQGGFSAGIPEGGSRPADATAALWGSSLPSATTVVAAHSSSTSRQANSVNLRPGTEFNSEQHTARLWPNGDPNGNGQ